MGKTNSKLLNLRRSLKSNGQKDSSLKILDLPDVALANIFSLLSFDELMRLRFVSTRMSDAVLKLDRRFKTWTINIYEKRFPQVNNKISQFNIKLAIVIDQYEYLLLNQEKIVSWMNKHASHITSLCINIDLDLNQRVVRSIPGFEQMRRLELLNASNELVKTLLSQIGPQLDLFKLTNSDNDETDFRAIDVSSLKYLVLVTEANCIHSFLRIVPGTLEVLDIKTDSEYVEVPFIMKQLSNLKTLRITPCKRFDVPKQIETTKLFSNSLTRLYLNCIELENLVTVDEDLPFLEVIGLMNCKIDMSVLKNLLLKSRNSLNILFIVQPRNIFGTEDFNFSLPKLNTVRLDMDTMQHNIFGLQLISISSESLTTLKISSMDLSCLNELACDLPVLRILSIMDCDCSSISDFLSKCSSSLQVIHLVHSFVNFDVYVPNLKELYLEETHVHGFTNLVNPDQSQIETMGLTAVEGSIWEEIIELSFPKLKKLYIQDLTEEQYETIESILTTDVEVLDHCHSFAWSELLIYERIQCDEYESNWANLIGRSFI